MQRNDCLFAIKQHFAIKSAIMYTHMYTHVHTHTATLSLEKRRKKKQYVMCSQYWEDNYRHIYNIFNISHFKRMTYFL